MRFIAASVAAMIAGSRIHQALLGEAPSLFNA
jgi:hypothetical protein